MPEKEVYEQALYLHPHPINIINLDGEIWRNQASKKAFSKRQVPVCKREVLDEVFRKGKGSKRQVIIAGKVLEIELTPVVMNGKGASIIMEEVQDVTDSTIDPLTKVHNRKVMEEFICQNIEQAKRDEIPFSVIMLDIDHFKSFNDKYGHTVGDFVLTEFASILKDLSRKYDTVFRYGGEEFLVLLPRTDKKDAFRIAERMRRKVESHQFKMEKKELYVTMSAGVAESHGEMTAKKVIKDADDKLLSAKESGRNLVVQENIIRLSSS